MVVPQVLSSIAVTPLPTYGPTYISNGDTQQFVATPKDQFGAAIANLTIPIVWSLDAGGVGNISNTGLYSAPASGGGVDIVRATSGAVSGVATISVIGVFSASQDIVIPQSPAV